MAEVLTAVEVTLDDLIPVMSGTDLVDVTLVCTIRYTDATFATAASRQLSISSYSLMTPEQQALVTGLAQSLKALLHTQYVGS
jgi:chorismate mutase